MQSNEVQTSRVRRTVNDLVMAEMFLVQATIESAAAIGDGLNELGKQISHNNDNEVPARNAQQRQLTNIAKLLGLSTLEAVYVSWILGSGRRIGRLPPADRTRHPRQVHRLQP